MLKKIRWIFEFIFVYSFYGMVKIMPWKLMRASSWIIGLVIYLIPFFRRMVRANIRCAMPELPEKEVRRVTRKSFDYLIWNLAEYIWMLGNRKRIMRCCTVSEDILKTLKEYTSKNVRLIYVTPHFGSWEAAGMMSPFFAGVKLAAIAKPVRNPYLDRMFNIGNRESTPGLHIIFSKGAIRAAIGALKQGMSIGILVDQNTKVRDGGVFVDFFGLPVPSSTAPAVLKEYCDKHDIPCEIIIGGSMRDEDGILNVFLKKLSKPYSEYANAEEILLDLTQISENMIRQNPDQYLWMYKRFQYIPENASPEQLKRYPFYAKKTSARFYGKKMTENKECVK